MLCCSKAARLLQTFESVLHRSQLGLEQLEDGAGAQRVGVGSGVGGAVGGVIEVVP